MVNFCFKIVDRSALLFSRASAKKILLPCLLVIHVFSYSQIINSGKCDSTDRFPITQYVSIFKTLTPVGLDSALSADVNREFEKAPPKPVLVLNYDPYYYWFRVVIRNSDASPKDLRLLMAPVGMKEGQLFQKQNGAWTVIGKSGVRYRFKDRPYQFTHNVFPFTLPANTTDTFYLSTDVSGVYKSFGFALIKPKDLKVFENNVYFIFGIIVGLLLLFFILNVSLFFVLKRKIHLWYALYIGFLFLIVMKNDHLDQQFLGWDSEYAYQLSPYMAIGAFAIAILMEVVQQFLKNAILPKTFLHTLTVIAKINVFLAGVAHYVFFYSKASYVYLSFAFNWAKYGTLLAILVIMICCVDSIRKGFKSAYFILAGLMVFLIGVLQRLFFPSTLSFLFPPTTFHIGMILETTIITLGLVYQYYWLEKEQDKQREIAFRKKLHEKELETMQRTMKNISGEIHDNVGQILSLAKLTINSIEHGESKSSQEKLNTSSALIKKAIHDLRNLASILNSEGASNEGLVELIRKELIDLKQAGKHETEFVLEGEPYLLIHQLELFRIFQEALNNAIKHAEATKISVRTSFKPHRFEMQISDNGIGFDMATVKDSNHSGLGLRNIQNRAKMISGDVKIETGENCGTTILVTLPTIESKIDEAHVHDLNETV